MSTRTQQGLFRTNYNIMLAKPLFIQSRRHILIKEQKGGKGWYYMDVFPMKMQGRPVILREDVHVNKKLQLYVRKVREGGGVIKTRIFIAACNHFSLVEFGGQVYLSWNWVYCFCITWSLWNKSAPRPRASIQLLTLSKLIMEEFLVAVVEIAELEEMYVILNWDQTTVKIIPSSSTWKMQPQGSGELMYM